ncbi:hypothetical protein BC629DRAFT_1109264 [Irpex lacteus]|nr:hypothetical protein BC629DRAFT_1109264 [Irpex lacteus]
MTVHFRQLRVFGRFRLLSQYSRLSTLPSMWFGPVYADLWGDCAHRSSSVPFASGRVLQLQASTPLHMHTNIRYSLLRCRLAFTRTLVHSILKFSSSKDCNPQSTNH